MTIRSNTTEKTREDLEEEGREEKIERDGM